MYNSSWQKEIYKDKKLYGKKIAIANGKIIAVADNYEELKKLVTVITSDFSCYSVPKRPDMVQILTLRLKSIKKNEWRPVYPIKFLHDDDTSNCEDFLIDSGADISVVDYDFGLSLGWIKDNHETLSVAMGIGGEVEYLIRENDIEIDGHKIKCPFLWLQKPGTEEKIIGREVIFDLFDIEFKQAEESITFKWRN